MPPPNISDICLLVMMMESLKICYVHCCLFGVKNCYTQEMENLGVMEPLCPGQVLECRSHRFRSLFLSCYTFTVLPTLSTLRQTHACSNSSKFNASTAKPMVFTLSHTLALTCGTTSPKTSGTLLPSSFKSQKFSQNISIKPHCPSLLLVCTVCVCMCVCVCVCVCVHVCVCVCAYFA